jgi:glycosyltransferase involved in cell wall biosynthesis
LAFTIISRISNKRQTYYLQGSLINEQVASISRYLFNVAAHFGALDKIIVSTNYALNKTAELIAPKSILTIIPQSIVTSWYSDSHEKVGFSGDLNILYVGRLAIVKRVDLFLRAFSKVAQDFPKSHAHIVGTGPQETFLRQLSNKLSLTDQVHFLGFIPHSKLPKYYNSSDIFVNCSSWPDPALTILEAMASHCAVIVSKMCSFENIIHGQNGLVFRNEDHDDLSSKLRLLLENESLRRKLAQNAFQTVKDKFDYKVVATQFERLFRDLIGET